MQAGSDDYKNKFINIPAGILRLFKSKFDWQHETKVRSERGGGRGEEGGG